MVIGGWACRGNCKSARKLPSVQSCPRYLSPSPLRPNRIRILGSDSALMHAVYQRKGEAVRLLSRLDLHPSSSCLLTECTWTAFFWLVCDRGPCAVQQRLCQRIHVLPAGAPDLVQLGSICMDGQQTQCPLPCRPAHHTAMLCISLLGMNTTALHGVCAAPARVITHRLHAALPRTCMHERTICA